MRRVIVSTGVVLLVILVLATAGCLAPPTTGTPSKTAVSSIYIPGQATPTQAGPTPHQYVTEVTPFETGSSLAIKPIETQGYSVFPIPNPVPEDLACLIYTTKGTYTYNGSAFSFNLKNPPMYIDYTVVPTNITRHMMGGQKSGSDTTIVFSDYSPYSWFIVTVRNKTTGEIYLKDGFGPGRGYNEYTAAMVKVINRDDLQVDFSGNQITATARIWVKPVGNFDNLQNLTFSDCKYWDVPRNSLNMPTATPTPTWAWQTTSTTSSTTVPTLRPN
ncbi:MAG: hypothetical protein NTZ39_00025 [Methanoregula sp.]|nr:hypothetical protein [Methanoregula sp.]